MEKVSKIKLVVNFNSNLIMRTTKNEFIVVWWLDNVDRCSLNCLLKVGNVKEIAEIILKKFDSNFENDVCEKYFLFFKPFLLFHISSPTQPQQD